MNLSQKLKGIEPSFQIFPKAKLDCYFVLQTLGCGNYGKVKLIEDLSAKRYAAKIFYEKGQKSNEIVKRMIKKEVAIMKYLDHPNIIKIYNVIENGTYITFKGRRKQVCYIVMELAEGGMMMDYLVYTGAFSEKISRFYLKQMLSAIQSIHELGVSHRDLKPENILFDLQTNIKICDFGISIYYEDNPEIMPEQIELGTIDYMAPELQQGLPYNGSSVDLFALGVILFIMITGFPPFVPQQEDP